MAGLDTVRAKDLNADGKLRRRYEIDEAKEANGGTLASFGALAVGAFLAIKAVLFGGNDEARASATSGHADAERPAAGTDETIAKDTAHGSSAARRRDDDDDTAQDSLAFTANTRFADAFSVFSPEDFTQLSISFSGLSGAGVRTTSAVSLPPPHSSPKAAQASNNVVAFPGVDQSAGTPATRPERDRTDADDGNPDDAEDGRGPRAINRLPVVTAPVILNELFVNQSIIIAMSDLLRHADDPDGDALRVINLTASSGQVADNGDGSWTFTPKAYDRSQVTFSYEISDDQGAVEQTAALDIVSLPGEDLEGGAGADVLVGTAGADRIAARDGDDVIVARADSDIVDAGSGDDLIHAGEGDDVVYGGSGNDIVFAGLGDDVVFGGDGDDIIWGEAGADTLFGEDGDDFVDGGAGDDRVLGGNGTDELRGGSGSDLLDGGSGADLLLAGDGDDIVIGGQGADWAEGGAGDDLFIASHEDDDDHYDGGDGYDTYSIAGTSADAIIDLNAGTSTSHDTGTDTLTSIENVIGGSGNDIIIANEAVNILSGGAGDDVFVFERHHCSSKGHGNAEDRRDIINDFDVGDAIDFTSFKGDGADDGWQRLTFVFDQAEFDGVGEIRYRYETFEEREYTVIEINLEFDIDGDDRADCQVELVGFHELDDGNVWY